MSCTDWEWWCTEPGARSAPEKDFGKFPLDVQGAFHDLMDAWIDGTLVVDGDSCKQYGKFGVLCLRHRKANNPFRVYFTMKGTIAVIIHAAYKNQQKIDTQTADLLKQRARGGSSKPFV